MSKTDPIGRLRLGVNIDHVATVRNARGSAYPDPVRAGKLAEEAGADGITAHLREDRRHISDDDIDRLMAALTLPLNFEMAATAEMQAIALRHRPHAVCIVPEKREERTTEGGLDVAADENRLGDFIAPLREAGCRVSLFIGHDPARSRPAHGSARRWWSCTPAPIATCTMRGGSTNGMPSLMACCAARAGP
jgi:pyridoxine 5-phosphate synthase